MKFLSGTIVDFLWEYSPVTSHSHGPLLPALLKNVTFRCSVQSRTWTSDDVICDAPLLELLKQEPLYTECSDNIDCQAY